MIQPASSKSRNELDLRCRRERFLATVYGGHGIEPVIEPIELAFGTAVHEPISLSWQDAETAGYMARDIMERYMKKYLITGPQAIEYPILAEALTFGFLYHVMPTLLETYEVESTEFRASYVDPKTGVKWRTRPDKLLRHRGNRTRWYWELKTHGVDPSTFARMWERKAQLHLGALAVAQETGEELEGIVVQGFWKGTKYKGSLRSRMIGGYRREGVPGVHKTAYRTEHAKGFEWFLASEYPGGVQAWVKQLPREVIAEAFPVTAPIAPNPKVVDEFLESYGYRELEIAKATEMILGENDPEGVTSTIEGMNHLVNTVFPKNPEACENPITHGKCQFYEVCWNNVVGRDPVGSGMYKLKVYKEGVIEVD